MHQAAPVRLSTFIETNLDDILLEWDAFAETLLPAAQGMSKDDLRDHSREILLAIARDMETNQTEAERFSKSKRVMAPPGIAESAASTHGAARQTSGFELPQLVGEFRAMRASVLGFWSRSDQPEGGKPAAEEIARFNEALDEALAASVERYSTELSKSRNMFLAVLGHDVRGPLSGIRMAADLLALPDLDGGTRLQVAMRIRRASDVISRLTTDLLEYTRSRLGRGMAVEKSPSDLSRVCEESVDALRGSHPDRRFEQRLTGDLRMACDAGRIQQMLSNLLMNAVQYGDATSPVTLDAEGDDQRITFKISNLGEPIRPEDLNAIFEPLIQIPRPRSRANGRPQSSAGLGLFIVREIVQGHQGTVSVRSSAEAGTVFTVELPKAPSFASADGASFEDRSHLRE